MADFTPTQGRYLSFIHAYTEGFGLPPAESEIATAMKVSPPSVNQMMKTLEKKSLIQREPGVPRSIKILVDRHTIPKWTKTITRTQKVWMLDPKVAAKATVGAMLGNRKSDIYRFKITLLQTEPAIWRRIEMADVTLGTLHELIQTSMGWTNSHLHQFQIGETRYTDPRFLVDAFDDFGADDNSRVRVSDLVSEHGRNFQLAYEYDFGDGWLHEVELEAVTQSQPRVSYPRCTDGERACPPEDIGGVFGFADFVDAITNSSHPEHQEMLEWHGPFDPAEFDAGTATRTMKQGLPVW